MFSFLFTIGYDCYFFIVEDIYFKANLSPEVLWNKLQKGGHD